MSYTKRSFGFEQSKTDSSPGSTARASKITGSRPKDFDFQNFTNETEYPFWWNVHRVTSHLQNLPETTFWNTVIALLSVTCWILVCIDFDTDEMFFHLIKFDVLIYVVYDLIYFIHICALLSVDYATTVRKDDNACTRPSLLWYVLDLASYYHYFSMFVNLTPNVKYILVVTSFSIRLLRPLRFLWNMSEYHLKGSVPGTYGKFIFYYVIIITIFSNLAIWFDIVSYNHYIDPPEWLKKDKGNKFFRCVYYLQKMVVRIGPDVSPGLDDDLERFYVMLSGVLGCLTLSGIMVAALSLVISIYMRPEEVFRQRFALIMQQITESKVPLILRHKVNTFYRMYWEKQKGVSYASLLHHFPPTFVDAINIDIYFECTQKNLLLRDLSYPFLTEISKKMMTVNYIPGDPIVRRKSLKGSIVYISYGDVEMLTAEDDETPMLRFARGTILNPCGGMIGVACSRAHVAVRAVSFCTAHVLKMSDLWRICTKYGKIQGQTFILQCSFEEHFEKVKTHYDMRPHHPVKHMSNLTMFKRNLIELKKARGHDGRLMLRKTSFFLQIGGCYIMRNQKNVTLHDESDEICLRTSFPCILQSQSSLQVAWQYFVAFFTFVTVFTHPYHLVYLKTISLGFYSFDYTVSFIYILDIIIHLSTGAKIEEGVPITFITTASRQLSNSWFILDVICVLPVFGFIGSGRFLGINKLWKIPKMFRALKNLEEYVRNRQVLRFLAYYLLFVICVFLVAAIQQGYWCFSFNYCLVSNFTQAPYWHEGLLDDGPTEKRLTYSLYWAVNTITFTTHKTSELTKTNWSTQWVMMVILFICTIIQLTVESTYSATIMVSGTMRDQYSALINTVKNFLTRNEIDPVLQHRFINYLKLCWHTDKAYAITHGKASIFYDLPKHVNVEIMALQRIKYAMAIPFMRYTSTTQLKTICASARFFCTSPGEILLNTGDTCFEMYVIKQGYCEVINADTNKVVGNLSKFDYFGFLEVLLDIPAYYTVRAVTHVEVFSFSQKKLLKAMSTPKIMDVKKYLKMRQEYKNTLARKKPIISYEMPPKPPNRERFPLPRKHEPDVVFMGPFYRLGFFSILRYAFPRFTLRPDGTYLRRYEWFRALCCFLSAIIFPVYTFLALQWPWLHVVCALLDIAAYYDIFQRMLVGYYDENGILVYHPASTAAHYMRGAFLVDLLGCLPMEALDNMRNNIYYEEESYLQVSGYQYLMYNRLIQLYRLPNALDFLNEYFDRQDIIFIIKGMPIFVSLLMVMTSLILESSLQKWQVIGGGWRITSDYSPEQGSWVDINSGHVSYNITESPFNAVLTMYYWATYETTSVGFNLFQPTSIRQMNIFSGGMIFALMFITYLGVQVISIRSSNVNQSVAEYHIHMKDMLAYMKREKLDKELQRDVVSYYEFSWSKMEGTDYRSVLKLVDQITLRTDAILHIYGPTFFKCPVLYHCDTSLLRVLGRACASMYVRKHLTVIALGDVIQSMYVIDTGIMEVRNANNMLITKLPRGSVFGNLDNKDSAVINNMFVCSTNMHLLEIKSQAFYAIIKDIPIIWSNMKECRRHHENYVIGTYEKPSNVMSTWRDRAASTTLVVVSRKGIGVDALSRNAQIYLIFVCSTTVYIEVYNYGFLDNSQWLLILLYILDFLFVFKFLLFYLLPYTAVLGIENKMELMAKRSKYYRTELKYDLFSVLPLELFCFLLERPWDWFPIFRLNRFLRVVTINSSLKRYLCDLSTNLTLASMLNVVTWFSLFVHATAASWHRLGVHLDYNEPGSSWRYCKNGTAMCRNYYFCSVYFILTTFSQNGIGDILPRQKIEVAFLCVFIMVSTMMYVIYVGEFSNIIQYQQFRCFQYYSEFLELTAFLQNNRVSKNLQNLAKKYTLHLWRESRGRQVPHFLTIAPKCLKLNVMSAAYLHRLNNHPLFKNCEPAFLRHVVGYFKVYAFMADMYVVKETEITNSMYFIHRGSVEEFDETIEERTAVYQAGEHFGTVQGLQRDTPYPISYKTVNNSQILMLCLDDWEYLLQHFPKSKQVLIESNINKDGYDDQKQTEKIEIEKEGSSQDVAASFLTMGAKEPDIQKLSADVPPVAAAPPAAAAASDTSKANASKVFRKPISEVKPFKLDTLEQQTVSREGIKLSTPPPSVKNILTPQEISQPVSELIASTNFDESFLLDSRLSMPEDYPMPSEGGQDELIELVPTKSNISRGMESTMLMIQKEIEIELNVEERPVTTYSRHKSYLHRQLAKNLAYDSESTGLIIDIHDNDDELMKKQLEKEIEAPAMTYTRRKSNLHGELAHVQNVESENTQLFIQNEERSEKNIEESPSKLTNIKSFPSGSSRQHLKTQSKPAIPIKKEKSATSSIKIEKVPIKKSSYQRQKLTDSKPFPVENVKLHLESHNKPVEPVKTVRSVTSSLKIEKDSKKSSLRKQAVTEARPFPLQNKQSHPESHIKTVESVKKMPVASTSSSKTEKIQNIKGTVKPFASERHLESRNKLMTTVKKEKSATFSVKSAIEQHTKESPSSSSQQKFTNIKTVSSARDKPPEPIKSEKSASTLGKSERRQHFDQSSSTLPKSTSTKPVLPEKTKMHVESRDEVPEPVKPEKSATVTIKSEKTSPSTQQKLTSLKEVSSKKTPMHLESHNIPIESIETEKRVPLMTEIPKKSSDKAEIKNKDKKGDSRVKIKSASPEPSGKSLIILGIDSHSHFYPSTSSNPNQEEGNEEDEVHDQDLWRELKSTQSIRSLSHYMSKQSIHGSGSESNDSDSKADKVKKLTASLKVKLQKENEKLVREVLSKMSNETTEKQRTSRSRSVVILLSSSSEESEGDEHYNYYKSKYKN